MPPKKEYIFEHLENSNIKVIIDAYNFNSAMETLLKTVRMAVDFKCINA